MIGELSRAANFFNAKGNPVCPPKHLAKDILGLPTWSLPQLEGLIGVPILRADGTVHSAQGYDEVAKYFVSYPEGIKFKALDPTKANLKAAVNLIEELLKDFSFDSDASKANAIALLFTPNIRPLFEGCVPLALIDAPEKGTGKTLLATTTKLVATGSTHTNPVPTKPDEWPKTILSILSSGESVVLLDNVRGKLDSPYLDQVLTSSEFSGRELGRSRMLNVTNRATWIATSNNAELGEDLVRRTYRIGLDAKCVQPWEREFEVSDLHGWVKAHRFELVSAVQLIARSWVLAGRPRAETAQLGGFEGWTETTSGVLAHAGFEGFLQNQPDLYASANDESGQNEALLRSVKRIVGNDSFKVSDLFSKAVSRTDSEDPLETLIGTLPISMQEDWDRNGGLSVSRGLRAKLGKHLNRMKNIRYGEDEIRLEPAGKDSRSGAKLWRIAELHSSHSKTSEVGK